MRGQFMVPFEACDDAAVSAAALGTWLRLARYCASKLNGGRISGCRAWKTIHWAMQARVNQRSVAAVVQARMARWDGSDLALEHYDLDGEDLYRRKSAGGRAGARMRWGSRDSREGVTHGTPMKESHLGVPYAQGGGKALHPSTDVSSETPARTRATQGQQFDREARATTWADKNPQLVESIVKGFEGQNARVIDVLRYFRVKFETKRDGALEGEWRRDTEGQQPAEVALVFVNAPPDAIRLPSQYRTARKAWETTISDDEPVVVLDDETEGRPGLPPVHEDGAVHSTTTVRSPAEPGAAIDSIERREGPTGDRFLPTVAAPGVV